uniref:Uncharacterized protein n=1 Tax=Oryza glumipatula TaxID=40148 RepID=A0A0E0ASA7_9ORYZ
MVDRIVPAASSSGSVLGMQVHVEPWPELGLLWQPGIPAQSLGGWSKREISTAHEAGIFRPNLRGIPGERTPVSGGQEKILARSASASSRATRSGHRRDSSGEMRHRRDSSSGETPPPGLLRRNATTTPGTATVNLAPTRSNAATVNLAPTRSNATRSIQRQHPIPQVNLDSDLDLAEDLWQGSSVQEGVVSFWDEVSCCRIEPSAIALSTL